MNAFFVILHLNTLDNLLHTNNIIFFYQKINNECTLKKRYVNELSFTIIKKLN